MASSLRHPSMRRLSHPWRMLVPIALLLSASQASHSTRASCGLDCAAFFDLGSFHSCLKSALPAPGAVVLPHDPAYANASATCNARFAPRPAAVVFAHSTADVVAAVKCGLAWGVRVSAAAGRHSNQATSIPDGYLIIDLSNLTKLEVHSSNHKKSWSARFGAGTTNILLATGLRKQWLEGRLPKNMFSVMGNCPSVGAAGLLLGGGMGFASRSHGLACDSVLELEMVLYNGSIIRANSSSHPDVLWASCGGGGGLGVITEAVVRLHKQPSKTFTRFFLFANASSRDSIIQFQTRFQDWVMSDDQRLGGGDVGGAGSGSIGTGGRSAEGLFWGDDKELRAALSAVGLLDPKIIYNGSVDAALRIQGQYQNYGDMFLYKTCYDYVNWGSPIIPTLFPGHGNASACDNTTWLHTDFAAVASVPGGAISSSVSPLWRSWVMWFCRLLGPPSPAVWEALLGTSDEQSPCSKVLSVSNPAETAQLANNITAGDALTYACLARGYVNLGSPDLSHLMGGNLAKVSPYASAFPWRTNYATVCLASSLSLDWTDGHGIVQDSLPYSLTPLLEQVLGYPAASVPADYNVTFHTRLLASSLLTEIHSRFDGVYAAVGSVEAAKSYVNYQTEPLVDWERAYFGPNVQRLASIKAKYDPLSLFSKQLIVQGKAD